MLLERTFKCLFFCIIVFVCTSSIPMWPPSVISRHRGLAAGLLLRSSKALPLLSNAPSTMLRHRLTSPPSWDWRDWGAVTSVKVQGPDCPYSSWAFAVVGAIEAQHRLYSRKLVELSVQQVLDCAQATRSGCDGGLVDDALEDIVRKGGLESEESYPYAGRSNISCQFDSKKLAARVSGYHVILEISEDELKMVVSQLGPVTVTIDGSQASFWSYTGGLCGEINNMWSILTISGVYYEPRCGHVVGHTMLLIGYGTDEKEGEYWILKNSFGKAWGEGGYIRMARNRKNNCCVACFVTLPYVPM